MAEGAYKYNEYCGRMGELTSIFFADSEDVAEMLKGKVFLDEPLGKHSQITLDFTRGDGKNLKLLSDDPETVAMLKAMDISAGPDLVSLFQEKSDEEK